MVAGLLKLVFILCTIAVVGLSVVDTLWFNAMPESNRYKNVQAFNKREPVSSLHRYQFDNKYLLSNW